MCVCVCVCVSAVFVEEVDNRLLPPDVCVCVFGLGIGQEP